MRYITAITIVVFCYYISTTSGHPPSKNFKNNCIIDEEFRAIFNGQNCTNFINFGKINNEVFGIEVIKDENAIKQWKINKQEATYTEVDLRNQGVTKVIKYHRNETEVWIIFQYGVEYYLFLWDLGSPSNTSIWLLKSDEVSDFLFKNDKLLVFSAIFNEIYVAQHSLILIKNNSFSQEVKIINMANNVENIRVTSTEINLEGMESQNFKINYQNLLNFFNELEASNTLLGCNATFDDTTMKHLCQQRGIEHGSYENQNTSEASWKLFHIITLIACCIVSGGFGAAVVFIYLKKPKKVIKSTKKLPVRQRRSDTEEGNDDVNNIMNEEANAILLVPNNISCHYTKETLHELPKQYLTGRNLTKNEILDQALGQNSTYNSDNQEKFVSDENKKYYSDQKQVVKDQITKFEEDLIAYSFYKECDKVKDMLSQQMELINLEITIENIETMEKHLQNAESLIQLQAEPEMKSLTERAEKLFVSGFPKAKLEKNHIESLLIEEKQLLEDKRQEMQGMKELITFFESCDTVDKRIQMEIDIISNCNNNDQLNDHKNSINNFKEIISKLSETCDRINAKVYTKYANEMNGKIKYLQELNEDFISHHLKPKHLM